MKIIGLDVGEKRIGVSKADSEVRIAVPVGFVEVNGKEWEELAKIARLNNTSFFVLGLPRSNEGNETKQTLFVRSFARVLTEKIPGAKVRFQDESLTSIEAENRLKARKKNYAKGEIDAEAATIILQDFIEGFKSSVSPEKKLKVKDNKTSEKVAEQPISKTIKMAEKQGQKVALKTKKVSSKLRKTLIISPIVLLVIIAVVVGSVIWRQNQLREREQMWQDLEAQMTPDVFSFTIRPGETIFDIKAALVKQGYSEEAVEMAFEADYSTEEGLEFLAERPKDATLEG